MALEVNDENFKELTKSGPVLVDFWASWCGPCRMLLPIIEELATDMKDKVKILKCNVDESRESAAKFDISGVPTLIIFKNGEVVARRSGMAPKKIIEDWINSNI